MTHDHSPTPDNGAWTCEDVLCLFWLAGAIALAIATWTSIFFACRALLRFFGVL